MISGSLRCMIYSLVPEFVEAVIDFFFICFQSKKTHFKEWIENPITDLAQIKKISESNLL